jgi:nucleoid DNA-binding protein
MLKRRKLKWAYYLVLVVILAVTIWANIRLYFINSVSCYSGVAGGCSVLLSYKIAEYLAYISLIILGVYIVYMYFVSEGKKYVQEEQADSPVDNKDYIYVNYEDEKMSSVEEESKTSFSEVEASDVDSLEEIEEQENERPIDNIPEVIETEAYIFNDSDDFDDDYDDDEFDEDDQEGLTLETKSLSLESIDPMDDSGLLLVSHSKKKSKPKDNSVYKKDIVKNIKRNTNLSNYKATMCLNIMLDEVSGTLVKGEIVGIEGLGTFKKLKVEEHQKINPRTNKEVTIEAHNRIQYKPDVLFIESLNKSRLNVSKKNVQIEPISKVIDQNTIVPNQSADEAPITPSTKNKKVSKPIDNSIYKKDIIKNIQKYAKISNYKASLCLNILVEAITETLINGEKVDIEGLGLFKAHRVLEHQKVDAIKKEKITIEAHGRITYKPDKAFKASLNEKKK